MSAILDFLRRLWPWRKRSYAPQPMVFAPPGLRKVLTPEPEPPPQPPPPEPEPEPEPQPEAQPQPEPDVEPEITPADRDQDGEPDEEPEEETDDEVEDPESPDPFISDAAPTFDPLSPDDIRARRARAREAALIGEHRVHLSEAPGPGTLGEALNRLLQEGLVTSEFRDDDEGNGPYLLYRPVEAAPSDPVHPSPTDEV